MIETLLEEELKIIHQNHLYRKLKTLKFQKSVEASYGSKPLTLFCGNDYLGLAHHPRVKEAAKRALETYGVGSGASRLISGTQEIHTELEKKLADFKKKERALVFSSGYVTNLGVISALAGKEDLIVMDKLCHASMIDGARLSEATLRVFPHKNYERLESLLEKSSSFRNKFILSETVFSMDGDLANLGELVRIKKKFDAQLIMDDAHGLGVLGSHGRGGFEDEEISSEVDVFIGTLSKAVGVMGGFAAASEKMIEYLINRSRPFIYATSLSPVLCAAIDEALEVIVSEPALREKLWENVKTVYKGLEEMGFELNRLESPIVPVMVGDELKAMRISEGLLEKGIFVPGIRTPTVPKGQARLRVTLSAEHTQQDLKKLLQAFEDLKS